jgi:hypothetical protein
MAVRLAIAIVILASGAALAQPLANLSRAGIEFGIVGAEGASDTQPVFVTNTGNASVTLKGWAVTGAGAAPFLVGGTCRPGEVLSPGGRCRIDVDLRIANPLEAAEATLAIDTDGMPPRLEVALHATAVKAWRPPRFEPAWIEFAPQAVGYVAAHRTMTLRNEGTSPLLVRALALAGGDLEDFAVASDCVGVTLRTGDHCAIHVGFLPTAAGPRSTQVLLHLDDAAIAFRSITGVGYLDRVPTSAR